MLPLKLRLKILNKLAQTVPGAPASPASPASPGSPASPASPASPNAPTTPDSTVGGAKPASQPASSMMNVGVGWPDWIGQIDSLVKKVDKVIIAGSADKKKPHNFDDLFQNKFPSGVDTEFPPPDPTGDVIRFGRQIWEQLMNSGRPFTGKLQPADMRNRVWALIQSPYLMKFQQINPAGPLGSSGAELGTLRASLQEFFNMLPQS